MVGCLKVPQQPIAGDLDPYEFVGCVFVFALLLSIGVGYSGLIFPRLLFLGEASFLLSSLDLLLVITMSRGVGRISIELSLGLGLSMERKSDPIRSGVILADMDLTKKIRSEMRSDKKNPIINGLDMDLV